MLKTSYDTNEDIIYLEQILWRAFASTDILFELNGKEFEIYRNQILNLRAKILEYLDGEEPNKEIIQAIKDGKLLNGIPMIQSDANN